MGGNSVNKAIGPMDRGGNGQWDKGHMPMSRPTSTIGFEPSCTCAAATRPGICLDPFMGSGTTALVARANGRHYIGCDLNPEYVKLARERLRMPFEPHHMDRPSEVDDLPLFAPAARAVPLPFGDA